MLVGEVESRLKELITEISIELQADLIEVETDKDHVYLLVEVDPQYGINNYVRRLKGKTSRILRDEFPFLRKRLPTLWTNSYFVSTVGGAPLEVVKQYIENQQLSESQTSKDRWNNFLTRGKRSDS